MRKRSCAEHVCVVKMIGALLEGSKTAQDIQEVTGWHETTVRRYVRALRLDKLIYITEWEQDRTGRYTLAAYSFGNQKDARKPKRISNAERCRRYKARVAHLEMIQMTAGRV